MKKINMTDVSNAGLSEIHLDPDVHEEMIKRTFTALRKFSSSRKTRSVHKILDNRILFPALFSGNVSEYLMSPIEKGNTLRKLLFNLYFFDDSLDRSGAVGYATEMNTIDGKIQKEKTFLSDKQVFNLEQLKEDKEKMSQKFLNSLDYIKLVDGTYFGWLLMLSNTALEQESLTKPKIVTLTSDILSSTLKKMYMRVNSTMDADVHQLFEAIAIYFIRVYYYGETAQYVLNLMQRGFHEDILDVIRKTKVTRFKEFNEISLLLKEAQLLPLTTNTFDLKMQKMFGRYGYVYYIQPALSTYIAFMANLAHPSQLFKDAFGVDDEACLRLEELLLNESKKIKIDKYES